MQKNLNLKNRLKIEISDKKMGDKIQLELQVKSLEKSMVTILKADKEIKSSVVKLDVKLCTERSRNVYAAISICEQFGREPCRQNSQLNTSQRPYDYSIARM